MRRSSATSGTDTNYVKAMQQAATYPAGRLDPTGGRVLHRRQARRRRACPPAPCSRGAATVRRPDAVRLPARRHGPRSQAARRAAVRARGPGRADEQHVRVPGRPDLPLGQRGVRQPRRRGERGGRGARAGDLLVHRCAEPDAQADTQAHAHPDAGGRAGPRRGRPRGGGQRVDRPDVDRAGGHGDGGRRHLPGALPGRRGRPTPCRRRSCRRRMHAAVVERRRQRDQLRVRGRRRQRGRRRALDARRRARDAGRSARSARRRQRGQRRPLRRRLGRGRARTAGRRSPTTATSAAPTAARPGSPSTTRSRPRPRPGSTASRTAPPTPAARPPRTPRASARRPPPRTRSCRAPTRSSATRRCAGSCSALATAAALAAAWYLVGWYRNRLRPYITAYVDDSEAIPLGRGPRTGLAFVGNEIHMDRRGHADVQVQYRGSNTFDVRSAGGLIAAKVGEDVAVIDPEGETRTLTLQATDRRPVQANPVVDDDWGPSAVSDRPAPQPLPTTTGTEREGPDER